MTHLNILNSLEYQEKEGYQNPVGAGNGIAFSLHFGRSVLQNTKDKEPSRVRMQRSRAGAHVSMEKIHKVRFFVMPVRAARNHGANEVPSFPWPVGGIVALPLEIQVK